jgi:superfamily II DNA/RNA helicase
MHDSWVATYQELLELEKQKVDEYGLGDPTDSRSFLSEEEIKSVCMKNKVDPQEFLSSNRLVQYPNYGWRTIHFDLLYRIVNIRNLEWQRPIPLEYKIEMKDELVPDFERYNFEEILPSLISNDSVLRIILSALGESKYKGLSSYQRPIIEELLSNRPQYTTAAIIAPTASGKSLAFFLPVLIRAIERRMEGETRVSSILVYPRKALERDQLQSFLGLVDSVNKYMVNQVTIGIDDGDTKRLNEIRQGDTYREMKCVICSNSLIIQIKEGKALVKCSMCSKEYPYILASKNEIWQKKPTILVTNIHTLYRRLLTPNTVKLFAGLDYIVFDEAHVYTDYFGGHVYYIIKLLRHASRSNRSGPRFVFSSATIPNPLDFITRLAGVEKDEIFHVDYKTTLEKAGVTGRRLMIYLYLLPHPDSNVETLTEAIILAVTLWCHKHNFKAITFVDSIAEIATISDYIHTTILRRREGREVTDHIYNTNNNPANSYNWLPLAPSHIAGNRDAFGRFVLTQYKESIDIHYGELSPSQRARIEYQFSQGLLKHLLATSTLELGIDLSDVAVITQHKLPITPEGVVQRVGRAGRSSTCLRVALGIIVLQSSPLSTLYMFDDNLRGRLVDPNLLPPARVGQVSTSIKLQHTLSLLLYKRALEGKQTFVAGEEYLKSKQAVINAVKEILSELNEGLLIFNSEVGLFDDNDMLRRQIIELNSLLSAVLDNIKDSERDEYPRLKNRWDEILNGVEFQTHNIQETLQQIKVLKTMVKKIQGVDRNVLSELESLEKLLGRAYGLCSTLLRTAKSSYRHGNADPILRWYEENSSDIEKLSKETPDADDLYIRLHKPLNTYFYNTMNYDNKAFRTKYGFGFEKIDKALTDIITSFGGPTEGRLASFLRELPNEVKFLSTFNLSGLLAYESLRRLESELKVRGEGIDIFDAINLLLLNRVRFSLMMEPPTPELQLAGVEET